MKHKKIIFLVLFFIVAAFAWFYLNKDQAEKKITKSKNLIIDTAKVERGNLSSTVSASGQVETANYLPITTSVNGIVKQVFVKEGDTVTNGQKVMEITLSADGEESLAQSYASYLSAKNSVDKANRDLVSLETQMLEKEKAFEDEKKRNSYQSDDEKHAFKIAENNYLEAKASYDSQKAIISQAKVSLQKAWMTYQSQSPVITAPGAGKIANIVVVEGMDITNSLSERTSTTVASIRNEGQPIASLNVSEVDINEVQVGQKVSLTLNSLGERTFSGKIVGIDKIGTSTSGVSNYPVIVKFDEYSEEILPNMSVDGDITTSEKADILFLPVGAVNINRGKSVVTKINNDKPVEIETGIKTDDYVEVLSGLNEGDEVIITSLPTSGFTDTEENNRSGGGLMMFGGPGR